MATSQTSPFFCRTPIIFQYVNVSVSLLTCNIGSPVHTVIMQGICQSGTCHWMTAFHGLWYLILKTIMAGNFDQCGWYRNGLRYIVYLTSPICSLLCTNQLSNLEEKKMKGFQSFDFERTWWRLFRAYMMKVILSVHDEGYFERTWWRLFWEYLMKVILSVPDEGYFKRT